MIATRVDIHTVCIPTAGYNISISVETEGNLGYTNFTLLVKTFEGKRFELPGSLDVIGVRLKGPVKVTGTPSYVMNAHVYSGRNMPHVKLNDCQVDVLGRAAAFEKSDVAVMDSALLVKRTRQCHADAKVTVVCPSIEHDGESAETEMLIGPDMREKKRQSLF